MVRRMTTVSSRSVSHLVASSSVIDMLNADPTLLLAYFYFDFGDINKHDCRALVSSLVFQIGTSYKECLDYLLGERSSGPPTDDKLSDMLLRLLTLSGPTFIVIDALDECPEHERDPGLLDFLEVICGLTGDDRLDFHLFLTSRPERDIERCMSRLATQSLNFHDDKQHRDDLYHHIRTQLNRRDVYLWSDNVNAKVQLALNEKANGMYVGSFAL